MTDGIVADSRAHHASNEAERRRRILAGDANPMPCPSVAQAVRPKLDLSMNASSRARGACRRSLPRLDLDRSAFARFLDARTPEADTELGPVDRIYVRVGGADTNPNLTLSIKPRAIQNRLIGTTNPAIRLEFDAPAHRSNWLRFTGCVHIPE